MLQQNISQVQSKFNFIESKVNLIEIYATKITKIKIFVDDRYYMMSKYQCQICLKLFKQKWQLERHQTQKKHPCKPCPRKQNTFFNDQICNLEDQLKETKYDLEETKHELFETKTDLQETKCFINELKKNKDDEKYMCTLCSKTFTFQSSLNKHRKNGRCKARIDNVLIYERELNIQPPTYDELTCRFCLKSMSCKQSYSRHMNVGCKEKIIYESDLRERVLANRREAVAQKAQVINNNNNYGDTNNIININLPPMNAFGSENLDYMTTKLLIKELENCKAIKQADVSSIVDRFTKLIHANPAHPENQNVLFKSLNSGFATVYTESGFQDQQATEVQDEIIQNVHKLIDKGCDEYNYNGKAELADALDNIDINYGKLDTDITEGTNTRSLSKCRNTIKAVLYSNREEITSTHKLIET